MSPDMCPDLICDIDAEDSKFVSLKYEQDDIDKTLAYCTDVELNLLLLENKGIYGFCYGKINYKQSIKYWSRERNKYKHLMKKLKDHHLKDSNQYKDYKHLYLNAEDMMHQSRFYRNDKHRYNTYMIPVKTELV